MTLEEEAEQFQDALYTLTKGYADRLQNPEWILAGSVTFLAATIVMLASATHVDPLGLLTQAQKGLREVVLDLVSEDTSPH